MTNEWWHKTQVNTVLYMECWSNVDHLLTTFDIEMFVNVEKECSLLARPLDLGL